MTETIEFTEMEEKNIVLDGVRKLYLVGLGTAVSALSFTSKTVKDMRGNMSDLSTKLVERGEEADKKTRDMVNKQRQTRKKEIRNTQKRVEKEVGKKMELLLHTVNIPSKHDINSLSNKVSKLNKKVEELGKSAVK